MRALKLNSGDRFGRLVVVGPVRTAKGLRWKCRCSCGGLAVARSNQLLSGHSKSCGCLHSEMLANGMGTTHGKSGMKEHPVWQCMI